MSGAAFDSCVCRMSLWDEEEDDYILEKSKFSPCCPAHAAKYAAEYPSAILVDGEYFETNREPK